MKRIISYFLIPAGCLMLAVASCDKAAPAGPAENMTFTAGLEAKTTLHTDGKSVYWSGDEHIAVYSGTGTAKQDFSTASTGAVASFSGIATEADYYYSVYPYSSAMSRSGSNFNIAMPHTMVGRVNSFAEGSSPAIGYTTAAAMEFYLRNVGALIKFTVTRSDVHLVMLYFGGELLGGQRIVTLDGENIPASYESDTATARSKGIAIVPSGDSLDPGVYYVPVWPFLSARKPESLVYYGSEKKYRQRAGTTTIQPGRSEVINLGNIDTEGTEKTFGNLTQALSPNFTAAANACVYNGTDGFATLPTDYCTTETTYYCNNTKSDPIVIRGDLSKGFRHTQVDGQNVLELCAAGASGGTSGRIKFPALSTRRLYEVAVKLYMPKDAPTQILRITDSGAGGRDVGYCEFEAPAEGGEVSHTIKTPTAGYRTEYFLCSNVPGCYIRTIAVRYQTPYEP